MDKGLGSNVNHKECTKPSNTLVDLQSAQGSKAKLAVGRNVVGLERCVIVDGGARGYAKKWHQPAVNLLPAHTRLYTSRR